MKRQKVDIKKTVKKRIENNIKERQKKSLNIRIMDEFSNLKAVSLPKKTTAPINVSLLSGKDRTALRAFGEVANFPQEHIYVKKEIVDYDVVICIPSYNRYKKIKRLINQFYTQSTKYTFKIVLLNDGSTSPWYEYLLNKFPEIIYIKNDAPNGKILHWYCYNQMWDKIRNIKCHAVLQMDDDFILCDDFLDRIVDLYFEKKNENSRIMAISPHLWSFKEFVDSESWWKRKDFVDGIALIDDAVIKYMEYQMKPVNIEEVSKSGVPVRAWTQISGAIRKMDGIIYRTEFSLVYHDGNDDSKLHPNARIGGGVFTQKYIGEL